MGIRIRYIFSPEEASVGYFKQLLFGFIIAIFYSTRNASYQSLLKHFTQLTVIKDKIHAFYLGKLRPFIK